MIDLLRSFLICRKSFLVIGDIMLDKYLIGAASRISPEAPVPVVSLERQNNMPGGAASVCTNLLAMNQKVSIMSIIGQDEDGSILKSILEQRGVDTHLLLDISERPTTVKTRILAQNNQQIARIDHETTLPIPKEIQEFFLQKLKKEIDNYNAILISDYLKGVLPKAFLKSIFDIAQSANLKTFVDPKSKDVDIYQGAYMIKPNRHELSLLADYHIKSVEDALKGIEKIKDMFPNVLATLGSNGMVLCDLDGVHTFDAKAQQVYDVTGAGDTVLAYVAGGVTHGFSVPQAVCLANLAASIKVSKVGTAPVSPEELNNISASLIKSSAKDSWEEFKLVRKGKRVVFTNGCFDILHAGHVQLLRAAKQQGDLLVVGLNSDASVKRLKGFSRPVNIQEDRQMILSALQCVDFVFIFDEDTASNLIIKICPDIYVKGGDNIIDNVPEKPAVEICNCEFKILPFLQGRSTTGILQKSLN